MEHQTITSVTQANALVLANAAELGALVVARIAGNDIANTLQGESATKDKLTFLLVGQLNKHIHARLKTPTL